MIRANATQDFILCGAGENIRRNSDLSASSINQPGESRRTGPVMDLQVVILKPEQFRIYHRNRSKRIVRRTAFLVDVFPPPDQLPFQGS
jgi:hypothetical protein